MTKPQWADFLDGKVEQKPVTVEEVKALFSPDDEVTQRRTPGLKEILAEADKTPLRRAMDRAGVPEDAKALPMTTDMLDPEDFELRDWQLRMIEKSREVFLKDGYLSPVLHVVGSPAGTDKYVVTHLSLGEMYQEGVTYEMREAFAEIVVKPLLETMNAFCYIISTECWMTKGEVSDASDMADLERLYEQYGSIQNMPGRIEAITHYIETKAGSGVVFAEISRDGDEVTLGEDYSPREADVSRAANAAGPMVGLLRDDEVAQA